MSKKAPWHERRFIPHPGYVEQACGGCGRAMWLPPSKAGQYPSCTRECSAQARERERQARMRPCETCGKSFLPRPRQLRLEQGRFCSQRCNTAFRLAGTAAAALYGWETRRANAAAAGT